MTEFQKYLLSFCAAVLFMGALAASFLIGRGTAPTQPEMPVNVVTDTIVVRDTLREKFPVYVDRWKVRTELVPVTDTIRRTDTLYMAVEIERREYKGDDYRAVVSGFRPSLDEIAVFPKTVYLQTEIQTQPAKKRARLGFGATAGPAVIWTPGNGVQAGAGVAAGLTLNF